MAEQEIDKLLLEIEVEDKTAGGSDKLVERFATTISKLNQEIAKLDVAKIESLSKAMSALGSGGGKGVSSSGGGTRTKSNPVIAGLKNDLKELEKQKREILKTNVGGGSLADALGMDISDDFKKQLSDQLGLTAIENQIAEVQSKIQQATAQQSLAPLLPDTIEKASANTQKLNSLTDIQKLKLSEVREQLKSQTLTQEEYVDLKEKELRLEKQIKGSNKNSFTSAIKRVAVYRAIRALLKSITNAFKEGVNNLALYSSEVNNTLSTISSSATTIKNSVGLIVLPLMQAFAPIIQGVAVGIGQLANAFSYLTAKLRGSATYLKVNTEYFKKMNEQSRLLSFDTFEKIQGGNDVSDMFTEESTANGFGKVKEELIVISTLLAGIATTLVAIGITKFVTSIMDGSLVAGLGKIGAKLGTTAGTVGIIVAGVTLLVAGIADIVTSWNNVNFTTWEKALTIVSALLAGVIGVVVALKALHLSVPVAIGLGMALAGGVALISTELSKATAPKNHAFGGAYNTADLFYANENGQTELIASTNSGGGAVMNMQQLEGAIFNGMMRAMSTGSGENAIYLDGNKVGTYIAGSNGFRSEANRRNTSLNWR